jgi:hypothetical protein
MSCITQVSHHPAEHSYISTSTHTNYFYPFAMEFHTNPPPSLPPDYHCLAKAIITLYPATSDNSELAHTTPRGSNGHRLSFGFGSKHDEDGDPINQPAKPKIGGGWGNFVRRLSMDMNKDKDVADVREGAEGQGQQQTGSPQDPAKFKTGKWSTNVEVAVTHVSVGASSRLFLSDGILMVIALSSVFFILSSLFILSHHHLPNLHAPPFCHPLAVYSTRKTHLLVIFSPEHPLATYPPPPGAPGYIHYSSDGHTCEHHPHPTSSEDKHTSIGRKIIDVFKPGGITKEEAVKEHIIDPTTGQPTECPPTEPSETHPEPIPFPAPTPEMVEKTFPAFVGGKATMYVAIPLGAIRVAEMKLVDDKRETGVRVPVSE